MRRAARRPVIAVLQRDLVGLYAEQWLGAVDAAQTNKCDLICFLGRPLARDGVDIRVHASDERLPLEERTEEELFRVVQEAVHNSVKHARPGRIDVRLYGADPPDGTLVVEVADDGGGFDPDLPRIGHLGLRTMRERVERIGGQLTIESTPTTSTRVRAVLPGTLRPQPAE